jgi:hypothetical protein
MTGGHKNTQKLVEGIVIFISEILNYYSVFTTSAQNDRLQPGYRVWPVLAFWREMLSKRSGSTFSKSLVKMSPVSRCMYPPCSPLKVTDKHKFQSSTFTSFVTAAKRTHAEVRNPILKL